ncbi:MAG TPA: prepilin-type N-terminal cleavage/methylation domain-containing protein [Phycisphaerae bacterium]|nr:prepilin-type N-terminal cleavage/methylation domain-containing protein [Phycisphaerae bacterium]
MMATSRETSNRRFIRSALTLVELLVVVAIMSILLSILLATLGKVRESARSVLCKNKLQGVSQSFQLFAEDYGHVDRGRESEKLGAHQFRLEDFQDSLYGTEEFFKQPSGQFGTIPLDARKQPLICPAGPKGLARDSSFQPAEDTITPLSSVSVGFNMRLHKANVKIAIGPSQINVLRDVTLTPRILEHPWTPLAFDVDGADAQARPQPLVPFYSAPSIDSGDLYANSAFWFPAKRHSGMVHAAFIGGHVWSSRDPKMAPDWNWSYQPPPDE